MKLNLLWPRWVSILKRHWVPKGGKYVPGVIMEPTKWLLFKNRMPPRWEKDHFEAEGARYWRYFEFHPGWVVSYTYRLDDHEPFVPDMWSKVNQ